MRKNYFMKNVLAASMLLAVSLGMSSCSGFIDAVIGTSDQPTTQPTTQPTVASAVVTADQTTITISSFDDMAKAISAEQNEAFVKAIEAKAAAGEEYTINIKSEKPLSTEDFEGFEIPRVEGAAVNIVFDQPLVTSESSPLKITADEKNSDTPTTAVNELTITLPDGADKVYLSVDLPETTVTLAGNVTYEYVEAITATNTLYVPSGAIIKEFYIKGGRVIVQSGGIIETYVYPASDGFIRISSDGVIPFRIPSVDSQGNEDWNNPVYQIADEQGNPYYIQNLKIVKGEAEYATIVHEINENKPFKKLIIADGAAVNYKNGEDIRIETIEGHGNARFLYGVSYESGNVPGEMVYTGNCDLRYVKNLSGVAFSPLWEDKLDAKRIGVLNIPANTKECIFNAYTISGIGIGVKDCVFNAYMTRGILGNAENCKFKGDILYFENLLSSTSMSRCVFDAYSNVNNILITYPKQPDGVSPFSFTFTFDNCEFNGNLMLSASVNSSEPERDKDGNKIYRDAYSWWVKTVYPDNSESWNQNVNEDINQVPEDNRNAGLYDGPYDSNNLRVPGYWKVKVNNYVQITYNDYTGCTVFNSCKYNGNALSPDMHFTRESFPYESVKQYYVIDGKYYISIRDPQDYNSVILREVNVTE